MYDLIGIGALNVDYIITQERLQGLDPDLKWRFAEMFEHNREEPVSESELQKLIEEIGRHKFDICLGGSAFNVVQAATALSPGFRLGYVGVSGDAPDDPSFHDWFGTNRVDYRFVHKATGSPPGRCVSCILDGHRSLKTCPGVNVAMADHLEQHSQEILDYFKRSKIVHVTSFFDDRTPSVLARLIEQAKRESPWLRVSFDPGHHWAATLTPDVQTLLRCSDYVFLNNQEFRMIGQATASYSKDLPVAQTIFRNYKNATMIIVLKRWDSISLFVKVHGTVLEHKYTHHPLDAAEIQDDTGAGDVFAAGFISGMLIPGLESRQAVDLGLRMVRSKLTAAGTSTYDQFPSILTTFLHQLTTWDAEPATRAASAASESLLIGCYTRPFGQKVKQHLQQKFGLDIQLSQLPDPHSTPEEVLAGTGRAVVILAGMKTPDERLWAREKAFYGAGLLRGRLGSDRVLLMFGEDAKDFSAVADIPSQSASFASFDDAMQKLEEWLRKFNVIPPLSLPTQNRPRFTYDFRELAIGGKTYHFTSKVASFWEFLVRAQQAGGQAVSLVDLKDACGLDFDAKITGLFKQRTPEREAYDLLVSKPKKDMYKLNTLVDVSPPDTRQEID